jgi:hypothetical protein
MKLINMLSLSTLLLSSSASMVANDPEEQQVPANQNQNQVAQQEEAPAAQHAQQSRVLPQLAHVMPTRATEGVTAADFRAHGVDLAAVRAQNRQTLNAVFSRLNQVNNQ